MVVCTLRNVSSFFLCGRLFILVVMKMYGVVGEGRRYETTWSLSLDLWVYFCSLFCASSVISFRVLLIIRDYFANFIVVCLLHYNIHFVSVETYAHHVRSMCLIQVCTRLSRNASWMNDWNHPTFLYYPQALGRKVKLFPFLQINKLRIREFKLPASK